MYRVIDIRPTKDKIAEIEKKQDFSADWFEESLQEMADWVETKWQHQYRLLAQQYAEAVGIRDIRIAELKEKLRETTDRIKDLQMRLDRTDDTIAEMVESRREFLDI